MDNRDGVWFVAPPTAPPNDNRLVMVAIVFRAGRRIEFAVERAGEQWRVWVDGRPTTRYSLTFSGALESAQTTAFLLAPVSASQVTFGASALSDRIPHQ